MALPVILVNSATGSDSCGNAAIRGTAAATDGAGTTVTLDGAPDLSGVATDGSAWIQVLDATAGARNFSKITGKDNTAKTVTVADAFGVSLSGLTWAINQTLASWTGANSTKLYDNNGGNGDAMPGWVIRMESGHVETWSGTSGRTFYRSGDDTDGLIELEGEPAAATRPVVTGPNANVTNFMIRGAGWRFSHFDLLANAGSTKSSASNLGFSSNLAGDSHRILDDVRIGGTGTSSGYYRAIAAATSGAILVRNCEVGWCYDAGIHAGANSACFVENTWVHDCDHGAGNGNGIDFSACGDWKLDRVVSTNNRGDGLRVLASGNAALGLEPQDITSCTVHSNGGDGVEILGASTAISGYRSFRIKSNIITANGGYGLNFTGASVTASFLRRMGAAVWNNNFGTGGTANTSGKCNLTLDSHTEEGTVQLDPQFVDATNATRSLRDYSVGTNMKEVGWPTATLPNNLTRSYVDIGYAERQEPAGGGGGSRNVII
jgi:hypothetical protein